MARGSDVAFIFVIFGVLSVRSAEEFRDLIWEEREPPKYRAAVPAWFDPVRERIAALERLAGSPKDGGRVADKTAHDVSKEVLARLERLEAAFHRIQELKGIPGPPGVPGPKGVCGRWDDDALAETATIQEIQRKLKEIFMGVRKVAISIVLAVIYLAYGYYRGRPRE